MTYLSYFMMCKDNAQIRQIILDCLHTLIAPILCRLYLAKNNTLLKKNVAYVSMATKYPIIKIVICANYEDIGHSLLPDTYGHTLMLLKK